MVAIGTLISAIWILAVNSWMQTPTGYAINAQGQFVPAGSGCRSSSIRAFRIAWSTPSSPPI